MAGLFLASGAMTVAVADGREAEIEKAPVSAIRTDSTEWKLASEMQRQIDRMNAKVTDRGVVLTLGDMLFTTGMADLKVAATGDLNKLVAFLGNYPNRTVLIEGYTDNVGSKEFNLGLSQRRADGVKSYLVGQGVGATRLSSLGKGDSTPIADNNSPDGQQLNRRVEVIVSNPP